MRRLGRALHISRNRRLILRIDPDSEAPMLGETVFDSNLNPVGVVEDIFGPVVSPYAAIRARAGDASASIGKPLYAMRGTGKSI